MPCYICWFICHLCAYCILDIVLSASSFLFWWLLPLSVINAYLFCFIDMSFQKCVLLSLKLLFCPLLCRFVISFLIPFPVFFSLLFHFLRQIHKLIHFYYFFFLINIIFPLSKHLDILKFNCYLALSTSEFARNFTFNSLVKWKYTFKFFYFENVFSDLFDTDFLIDWIVMRENSLCVEMYWDFLHGLFYYSHIWEKRSEERR